MTTPEDLPGTTPASSDLVVREQYGAVARLIINRASKANALSIEVLESLDAHIDAVGSDATTRAVVVTGAGDRAFSAGADISQLVGLTSARARALMRRGQDVFDRLEALPVPVIAAIGGIALGGGLELAMACDIRFAATGARLGQPEILLANLPGWGGTQRLPRLVGIGRALELILFGDTIDAAEGWRIGLVNRVVEADDLHASTLAYATALAERAPAAVAGAKLAVHTGLNSGIPAGLVTEADCVARCCTTDEQRAAVRAFLEKKTRARETSIRG